MADRTSASIFGEIFGMLAKNPTLEHREMARQIFQMSKQYDFSEYQMYADEACLVLGIARRGISLDCPEFGEVILWPDDEGYDEAGQE